MHLGWILDADRAYRFVKSHGIDPTISDDVNGSGPNYYAACKEALSILLHPKKGVVPFDSRIKVTFFSDGQFVPNPVELGTPNFHIALSVGTNYAGAIPMEHIERLKEAVAPGVRPKWFLDTDEWFWTRRQSSKSSSGNSMSLLSPHVFAVVDAVDVPRWVHNSNIIQSSYFSAP